MVFKLSPSSLNLMKECPRCFWLTQHKVWKRPSGIFPSLPSGMDKILKEHFNKFMEKGQLPPELSENGKCKNMKLFDDHALLAIWRSNFKGIIWEDKKGNILRGAVDNILMKGKKLIVLDYKTRGYPLKEDTANHYQNQLDIYNFLLRKVGYETENYAFLLFYVPSSVTETGEVIFDTTLKKMTINIKNAENIFNKAIKLLNSECPKKSCEWCEGR
ncbi:MAG: PD-(D/E)XK nuclease family protein [Nanoarchaeota archaeon]|nr:PD-(D/E)XK nuclease family protein [Nanoarchaeota archaeon]MBU1028455.1 PD-(D/E)XK nuclease family protein [Nanoarchaeota archaeon]